VEGATWHFDVTDAQGAASGSLTVRVTNKPAKACLRGDWKQLELVSQRGKLAEAPVWTVEGDDLSLLLASKVCDAYPMLHGGLSERGFSGEYYFLSLDGTKPLGHAVGVRLRR
jgi:hypothetical protein